MYNVYTMHACNQKGLNLLPKHFIWMYFMENIIQMEDPFFHIKNEKIYS